MIIKELHLRNIASIETADIDFTKDLNDAVTGDPASVFLISGDTGAGKSVILDGISMALYKNTPRMAGVRNSKNNEFVDSTGECIRVASIEQYTRLGISAKDPSYSELVFVGNDNVEYRARLTLGMMLSNTDKTTGRRYLKHRSANWEVKAGNSDWISKGTDKVILKAVGLTFEQFGRMAMLAQGQFASFLTGEKAEREAILEQLTNTELFSTYGEAIKKIFDRARTSLGLAKSKYDTERTHTLPQEELDRLAKEKAEAEEQKSALEKELGKVQGTIDLVKELESSRKAFSEASESKSSVEEKKNGSEYKDASALVSDWDATTEQRQRLSDKHHAYSEREKAKETEMALKATFGMLASDLLAKRQEAKSAADVIARKESWLAERAGLDALYTDAKTIDLRLESYIASKRELADNEKSAEAEKAKTAGLESAWKEAQEAAVRASGSVKAKQDEIDARTAERQSLEPERVNGDISAAQQRKSLLERVQAAAAGIENDRKALEVQEKKICSDEAALEQLRKTEGDAQTAYDKAFVANESAKTALYSMSISLDDKMIQLRRKLVEEHAEICPLCGQHITEIHLEDEFKGILSPLEEIQKGTEAALAQAGGKRDAAKAASSSAVGALEAARRLYGEGLAGLKAKEAALAEDSLQAGLDASGNIPEQVAASLVAVASYIESLRVVQQKAESIQAAINDFLREKQPLDAAKAAAERKEVEAKNAFEDNANLIATLAEGRVKLLNTIAALSEAVSGAMGAAYPDWAENTESVRVALCSDAGDYNRVKAEAANDRKGLDSSLVLIENIERQRSAISGEHGDWGASAEAAAHPSRDILGEWTKLSGDVQRVAAAIEGYDAKIRECENILESFYAASGKCEADLVALVARKDDVDGARALVRKTDEALASASGAMSSAGGRIADAMEKLGVETDAEVPVLEDLELNRTELENRRSEALTRLGVINQALEADSENKSRLKAAEEDLETASKNNEKWDRLNRYFGGTRFRTLVQTHILRPLLSNANIYLEKITDRYTLTCSEDNDQLAILVQDRYNKDQVRSVTVLSGGERFMISLALSLALSSLNRADMNVNILFIDEGFGTLDERNLDSVMQTLERLQEITSGTNRRVGIISHREELDERVPVQIRVVKRGEGRSQIEIKN